MPISTFYDVGQTITCFSWNKSRYSNRMSIQFLIPTNAHLYTFAHSRYLRCWQEKGNLFLVLQFVRWNHLVHVGVHLMHTIWENMSSLHINFANRWYLIHDTLWMWLDKWFRMHCRGEDKRYSHFLTSIPRTLFMLKTKSNTRIVISFFSEYKIDAQTQDDKRKFRLRKGFDIVNISCQTEFMFGVLKSDLVVRTVHYFYMAIQIKSWGQCRF